MSFLDWDELEKGEKLKGTAFIYGGSAGLLAARFCHDHFETIVVVEAEAWTGTEEAKAGRMEPIIYSLARVYITTIPLPGESLEKGESIRWYMRRLLHLELKNDESVQSSMWRANHFFMPHIRNFRFHLVLKVLDDIVTEHLMAR
ncbi:hypothetical protein C8J56DRAFT_1055127 [Mycena floridula]|nr:hypothetical protein C8J56DRAFT_1055127 [Mycena floridula]